MRPLLIHLSKAVLFVSALLIMTQGHGQKRFAPAMPVGVSDFQYAIENDVQTTTKKLRFDLYIKDMDPSNIFELSAIQAGILINNSIIGGGTLSVAIVSGSSQLVAAMVPTSISIAVGGASYPSQMIIKLAAKVAPPCGSGTFIPSTGLGTRVCTIEVTNTLDFPADSQPGLTFCFTTAPYPTKVFQRINCVGVELACNVTNSVPGTTYLNPQLNPSVVLPNLLSMTPSAYNTCVAQGGTTTIGVSGATQATVTYTLYKDGVAQTPEIVGTGSAITWTLQPGSDLGVLYKVKARITATPTATRWMTGDKMVYYNPVITFNPLADICDWADPITLSATPTGAGGVFTGDGVVYTQNTYTYTFDPLMAFGPGTYDVTYAFSNSGGCAATPVTQPINVLSCPQWTGALSSDWNDVGNWSAAAVPLTTEDALIPNVTTYPILTSAVACKSLTIASGSDITIGATASLTLTGQLTLKGAQGLKIKSTAAGTGSLLESGISGSGTANIERFLTGYTTPTDLKFHFLSSPVAAQAIQPGFVSLPNATDDFYKFDEPTATWINTRTVGGTWNSAFENNFVVGRGYLVSYPGDATKNFIGAVNTSPTTPVNLSCTYTYIVGPPYGGRGWNFIGNPYPSAIDWDQVVPGNTNMDNALYYYDAAQSNYRYYIPLTGSPGNPTYLGSGSRYIPAMQGIMVHAKSGGGTVSLNNTMRTNTGMNTFYKSAKAVLNNYLVMTITGNTYSDQAFVYFTNQATENFDGNLDAHKLMSMSEVVPMIYTLTPDGTDLAINSIPPSAVSTPLPLQFVVGEDGDYTITASELSTFHPGATITLEDLKLQTSRNLMTNPVYSFSALVDDDPDRFRLHFAGPIGTEDHSLATSIKIYSSGKSVYVSSASGMKNGTVTITDLLGQIILSRNLENQQLNIIRLSVTEGYYIVKVQTENTLKTNKVFIR